MKSLIHKLLGIDKIIEQQKKTNELLSAIYDQSRKLRELNEAYNRAYNV